MNEAGLIAELCEKRLHLHRLSSQYFAISQLSGREERVIPELSLDSSDWVEMESLEKRIDELEKTLARSFSRERKPTT